MKKKRVILMWLIIGLFIINTLMVMLGKMRWFDNLVYTFIRMFECSFLDNYFVFITKFGNPIIIVIMISLIIFIFKNKHSLMIVLIAACTALTNVVLKYIIRRERPLVLKLIEQGGYSYPSGHAMIAVSLYGYMFYIVCRRVRNKKLRKILCALLVILILSIGASRIYLGVHFASDIIGGFLLAMFELLLLVEYSDKKLRGN